MESIEPIIEEVQATQQIIVEVESVQLLPCPSPPTTEFGEFPDLLTFYNLAKI